jgi:UDP-N-acetylglucosamine--N-acetylmuramyl-(pentapeptide) pyrophosphoryl-undecaprenol N-acetylglucosamine transferase
MAEPRPLRVLIAGGGTGGHLYPGIALAEEITSTPGGEVLFVGTARGLETKLVPQAGFPLELMEVSGLKRTGVKGMLRGLALLPRAFARSRDVLRRYRPDLVVGVGGYASGPLVLVAALTGYPTVIQEQNSRPGFTNRVLGRLARRVFVAFGDTRRSFGRRKLRMFGNPVRRRFLDRVGAGEGAAQPTFTSAPGREPSLLVLGGSQGSHAINELASAMVQVLKARGILGRVVHQVGAGEIDRMVLYYEALGLSDRVEARAYIDDMPAALGEASLVIARAGALTLAELAIMGRPAVLIPLPTATDDHQTLNALEFERAGAAVVVPQYGTTPSQLANVVQALLADPARLAAMAQAMRGLARPNATREIVAELRALVERRGRVEPRAQATPKGDA